MALKVVGSNPIIHPIKKDTQPGVFFYGMGMGFERPPPVRTLVEKVSGGHFLGRGRIHGTQTAATKGRRQVPFLVWYILRLEAPKMLLTQI